ncbi:MAG: flavocytochrome c [Blautia sp.]|nr:flavocytochrome c [Blautia sp.]
MRRMLLAMTLSAAMVFGAAGVMAEELTGVGSAPGIEGEDVVVEVVATPDEIISVTVTEQNETPGIGSVAAETVPEAIVTEQTLEVDDVAGATVTSNAVKEAVRQALESVGLDPAAYDGSGAGEAADAEPAEDVTLTTDVVVVGAGGAGMTAAIEAKDAGKEVIVVESQAMVGGNSVRSTGGLNAAKTALQDENAFDEGAGVEKQLAAAAENYASNETITALAAAVQEQWDAYNANPEGYFDSVELFELDTMIGGKGINNPELVAALCENSAAAVDWLESVGAPLPSVSSFGGASVKRIHRPVNDEGKTVSVGSYIVPILKQNLEDRGIELMLNTTATKLLTEEGKVVGIEAAGASGETVTIQAGAVVLATGGFGANLEMVSELKPELDGFMTTNASGILGQGIAMAEEIGAATVDMDQIQIHPTVQADTASLITEGLRGDGAILVNEEGLRFIDEVGTRDVVSAAEIAQTNSHSYLIVDQAMVDASSVIQGYINAGFTLTGETYEELAEAAGIDAEAFAKTMETWNGYVAEKSDPEFNRTSFANPLDTAPFYAINVTAGIHHTMGGLSINPDTQVLDADGNAIEGLYAAGEVTGGVHGANRLGGNAVADFVVFGRIAGQNAAAYVG